MRGTDPTADPTADPTDGAVEALRDEALDDLIHAADLDGLVRMIDDRTSGADWAGLLRLRDRARHAVETGRQLWPAATLAEYRLALHATAPFVAAVLDESDGLSGRFTIGPLTEVAAQHHSWAELSPVLDRGPRAAFVAHECALRGETIVGADDLPAVLDIPFDRQAWEPEYSVATYSDSGAEFPAPDGVDRWVDIVPTHADRLDDDAELAVRQLVEPWLTTSNGRLDVACVVGDAAAAIGSLGVRRARISRLEPSISLAWIAWAGASGGAHGRRRGAASGRFGAWWLLAAIGDLTDRWPVPPDELGELAHELVWYRWDAHEPTLGWTLQIAIEDPVDGIAWAVNARDAT
jgi:hypothetical protein